jgi:hypothetical protein
MRYKVNDRVALKHGAEAPAGSCGMITKDYGDDIHYDVLVTQSPPPKCEEHVPILAIFAEVVKCRCR